MADVCIVKIVLINLQEKVLLQLRASHVKHGDMWGFWGGYVEKDETPDQAIVREVKEEIDFDIEEYTKIEERIEDGQRRIWYMGEVISDMKKLQLFEGQDWGFFTYKETKKLKMSKNTRNMLKRIFKLEPEIYKQVLKN